MGQEGDMVENIAWSPDSATHPGEHLAEYLDVRGLSQAEFARLAGLTPKLVSTIIKGTNPVTPDTAIKLERVLGLKAKIWLGIQNDWDFGIRLASGWQLQTLRHGSNCFRSKSYRS